MRGQAAVPSLMLVSLPAGSIHVAEQVQQCGCWRRENVPSNMSVGLLSDSLSLGPIQPPQGLLP